MDKPEVPKEEAPEYAPKVSLKESTYGNHGNTVRVRQRP